MKLRSEHIHKNYLRDMPAQNVIPGASSGYNKPSLGTTTCCKVTLIRIMLTYECFNFLGEDLLKQLGAFASSTL